jgi:hypothetical protein
MECGKQPRNQGHQSPASPSTVNLHLYLRLRLERRISMNKMLTAEVLSPANSSVFKHIHRHWQKIIPSRQVVRIVILLLAIGVDAGRQKESTMTRKRMSMGGKRSHQPSASRDNLKKIHHTGKISSPIESVIHHVDQRKHAFVVGAESESAR